MPCGDIPGRVHIRVTGETAGDTGEEGLALAALRCDVPARRATLAGERGTDLLDPARSLIGQAAHQQSPARPHDPAVEPSLLGYVPPRFGAGSLGRPCHIRDVQVLDPDQVEPAHDVRAGFLAPVLADVGFTGFQTGDGQPYPPSAARTAAGACQPALQSSQALVPRCVQAR